MASCRDRWVREEGLGGGWPIGFWGWCGRRVRRFKEAQC